MMSLYMGAQRSSSLSAASLLSVSYCLMHLHHKPKNRTLKGGTSPYSLSMGVPPARALWRRLHLCKGQNQYTLIILLARH